MDKSVSNQILNRHKIVIFVAKMELNLNIEKLKKVKNDIFKLKEFLMTFIKENFPLQNERYYEGNMFDPDFIREYYKINENGITNYKNFFNSKDEYDYVICDKIEKRVGINFLFDISDYFQPGRSFLTCVTDYFNYTFNKILEELNSNYEISAESFTVDNADNISIAIHFKNGDNSYKFLHQQIVENNLEIVRNWQKIFHPSEDEDI